MKVIIFRNITFIILSIILLGYAFYIKRADNNLGNKFDLSLPVKKVMDYLKNIEHYEVATLLMIESLSQAYSLEGFQKISPLYRDLVSQSNGAILDILYIRWRMIDKKKTVSKESFNSISGVDVLTMHALHCDYLGMPNNMAEQWFEALATGGYRATHVALGYMWADDNQCVVSSLPDNFSSTIATTLVSLIDVNDGLNDLEIESMCFLLLLDREDLFMTEWLEALLDQQNSDGGWAASEEDLTSAQHTSALAACVLFDLYYHKTSSTSLPTSD